MLDCQFCIHASKDPVIIMNQLKSIYSSLFKDSHSHTIHICFPIIASNGTRLNISRGDPGEVRVREGAGQGQDHVQTLGCRPLRGSPFLNRQAWLKPLPFSQLRWRVVNTDELQLIAGHVSEKLDWFF